MGTTVVLALSHQHRPTRSAPRSEQPKTASGNSRSSLVPVKESVHTETSKEYQLAVDRWDTNANDLQFFRPERYLPTSEGDEHLGLMAGPHITFGGGSRGCFGTKMAYLKMRIVLALILWNFELLPVPEELARLQPVEVNTVTPKSVHVRLRKIELGRKSEA